jgi:hypothetical protein
MIGDDFPTSKAERYAGRLEGLKEAVLIAEYSGEPYCHKVAALILQRAFDVEQEGK